MIKYEAEIKQLLTDLFREDWMDDQDYEDLELEMFSQNGLSYQKLSDQIQIGVDNGYDVATQVRITKHVIQGKL